MTDDQFLIASLVAMGVAQGILFELGKKYLDRQVPQFSSIGGMLLMGLLVCLVGAAAFGIPVAIFHSAGILPFPLGKMSLPYWQWYWGGGVCLGIFPLRLLFKRRYRRGGVKY